MSPLRGCECPVPSLKDPRLRRGQNRYPVAAADGAGITAFRGMKSLQPAPLLNFLVRCLMSQAQDQIPTVEPRRQVTWKLALMTSGLAALAGVVLAVLFLNMLFAGGEREPRTVGGMLFILLGFVFVFWRCVHSSFSQGAQRAQVKEPRISRPPHAFE